MMRFCAEFSLKNYCDLLMGVVLISCIINGCVKISDASMKKSKVKLTDIITRVSSV